MPTDPEWVERNRERIEERRARARAAQDPRGLMTPARLRERYARGEISETDLERPT
jgi:uncharacterized membrane protein